MWKYTTYLQTGLSHDAEGIGCQDSVLLRENEHCIVAALSDGLGSLCNSHIASQSVTEGVWEFFSTLGEEVLTLDTDEQKQQFAASLVEMLANRIYVAANSLNLPVHTMDCTLGFVYISKVHNYAVVGRLGDSAICLIQKSASIAINGGGYSANATSAVLDRDAVSQLMVSRLDLSSQDIQGFVLCSDGLDGEVYMKGSPHVKKAAELYFNSVQNPADPQQAIRERIAMLTATKESFFDDDISVAVVSRAQEELMLPDDPTWLCTCGARNRLQDTYCTACGNDFTLLYRKVRFREHGGKSTFFLKINQDPEREMQLLGLVPPSPADTTVEAVAAPAIPDMSSESVPVSENSQDAHLLSEPEKLPVEPKTTPEQTQPKSFNAVQAPNLSTAPICETVSISAPFDNTDPPENSIPLQLAPTPVKKAHYLGKFLLLIGIFLLGLFMGILFRQPNAQKDMANLTQIIEEQQEQIHHLQTVLNNSQSPQETLPEESAPAGEQLLSFSDRFIETPDGHLWWGNTCDGLPDGPGVYLENGYLYIGTFQNGQQIGTFYVCAENGCGKGFHVSFDDFGMLSVPGTQLDMYTVAVKELELKTAPGEEGIVICCLENGDTVYVTLSEAVFSDGQRWVEVICGNTIGWVDSSLLCTEN